MGAILRFRPERLVVDAIGVRNLPNLRINPLEQGQGAVTPLDGVERSASMKRMSRPLALLCSVAKRRH